MYFVYVLKCSDNTYYTGCTNNLQNRLERHSLGKVHYTKDKLPVKLIMYSAFNQKLKAFEFEKYLKSASGIAFRNRHFL
jgi:putative endonuclease